MIDSMWVLVGIIALLVALLAFVVFWVRKVNKQAPPVEEKEIPADCCGAHEVCERDSLLSKTDKIIYFDDEELDELAGIAQQEYTDEQCAKIEDVFFTLREQDVAGWVRSMQLRNIELPDSVREQALLIVAERRLSK